MALRLIENLNIPKQKHAALLDIARANTATADRYTWLGQSLPPSNIPLPPTPLIWRDDEVSKLQRILLHEPGCLQTLIGPPGVGKTRLALQVGTNMRCDFEDGVILVALASVEDSEFVLPFLAKTLNLQVRGQQLIIDQVINHLRDSVLLRGCWI